MSNNHREPETETLPRPKTTWSGRPKNPMARSHTTWSSTRDRPFLPRRVGGVPRARSHPEVRSSAGPRLAYRTPAASLTFRGWSSACPGHRRPHRLHGRHLPQGRVAGVTCAAARPALVKRISSIPPIRPTRPCGPDRRRFGIRLDAASGVMRYLAERKIGFRTAAALCPSCPRHYF